MLKLVELWMNFHNEVKDSPLFGFISFLIIVMLVLNIYFISKAYQKYINKELPLSDDLLRFDFENLMRQMNHIDMIGFMCIISAVTVYYYGYRLIFEIAIIFLIIIVVVELLWGLRVSRLRNLLRKRLKNKI